MRSITTWIKDMLSESGAASTMRLAVLVIVIAILFNWTWHNITKGVFVALDWGSVTALIGTLLSKAVQKGNE